MTKQELIEKLKNVEGLKPEAHIQADELLLEYIADAEVTKTFNNIDKWYE